MRFIFPASPGIDVPSLAMSKRSPPCLGSEDAMVFGERDVYEARRGSG